MDFSLIVDTFERMEQTSSRLALTDHLVGLLKSTPSEIIDKAIYLIQGKIYPDFEGVELGLAEKMALKAISQAAGVDTNTAVSNYRKTGDLGDTAAELLKTKNQTTLYAEPMTVERVHTTLEKIATVTGPGSQDLKLRLVISMLNDSDAREARYIIKILMGTLRLGIADYTVMDALSIAFTDTKTNRKVLEHAYNVSSDLGSVAKILATKGLKAVLGLKITLFKPIRPMLAERTVTVQQAMDKVGGKAAAEYKLDGERIQIHKGQDRVELFSRRLEKITDHYPDIAASIMAMDIKEAIFEAEVVAINTQTDEYLPFQELMHRRRKHGIEEAVSSYPVVIKFFDILYIEGKDMTTYPYIERRKLLNGLVTRYRKQNRSDTKIRIVEQEIVTEPKQAEEFMEQAIDAGCEGLMIKQISSKYRAGAREYAWIKLKREYSSDLADTFDLVVVGALFGRGRRVGKYGALLLACYDSKQDVFRSVCKVGAGFTDQHLEDMYKQLEHLIIPHRHARVDTGMDMDLWFEPKIVIEVSASEITISPSHTAGINSIRNGFGLALRFPKFTGKIRYDKNPEDATDTDEIINMYKLQLKSIKNKSKDDVKNNKSRNSYSDNSRITAKNIDKSNSNNIR